MHYKNIFFSLLFVFCIGCVQPIFAMLFSLEKHTSWLFQACEKGHDVKDLHYFVMQGANVNAENYKKFKPLHVACLNGHIDIVKFLIENGADVNVKTSLLLTPLHCAIFSSKAFIVRLLIDAGADLDVKTITGSTALDLAHQYENVAIIELFSNESGEDAILGSDF